MPRLPVGTASPDWLGQAQALIGREFDRVLACDPVNAPMCRHWQEAFGLPMVWEGLKPAPASMLQVWLSPGPSRVRPPGSAEHDATSVHALLAKAGYTGVVTVSTELEFLRSLLPGDLLSYTSTFLSMGEDKQTGLGIGRFLQFRQTVLDAWQEPVGIIHFTNLVYCPKAN